MNGIGTVAGAPVTNIEVTGQVVNDFAVPRRAKRGRDLALRTGDQQRRDDEGDHHERHRDQPPGRGRRVGPRAGDVSHRKPPFGERPAGPLPHSGGLGEDVFEEVRRGSRRQVVEDARERSFEAFGGGHATCPPGIGDGDGGSVSTAARISPRARWRRDLTVPVGMPSVAATSVNGIPR